MIRITTIKIPCASLGASNPLPDIGTNRYLQATLEVAPDITEEESRYLSKGMIRTILPYTMQDSYDRTKEIRELKVAVLENEHLRATFLLEYGGRLYSLYDKDEGRELLYRNPVFQPGNLALRNAWFSGGVEFNFGMRGHTPYTCSPMHAAIDETPRGEVLRLWEFERIRGMTYSISAWLPHGSRALYLRPRIENRTNEERYVYWWSNIAVPETEGTRVIVPAREAFHCTYQEGHYLYSTLKTPYVNGQDHSYPRNISHALDYFYKIPSESAKWIATANGDGHGLLQCSTAELFGRKLFVWGQGMGGRHWNEWLSEPGSYYIEIQAGLAHTQFEHIPLAAHTDREWIEAYTAFSADPKTAHGDYDTAVAAATDFLAARIGDPNALTFPKDSEVLSRRTVHKGSDWGAIEELLRGERISADLTYPAPESDEVAPWLTLLQTGRFPVPNPLAEPSGYVADKAWLPHLEALREPSWFSLLHIGLIRYANEDHKGAEAAWRESLALAESPFTLRNLAMLYQNVYHEPARARELLLRAHSLLPGCRALAIELAAHLTENGGDALWIELEKALSPALRAEGRIRLYTAIALLHLDLLCEASEIINADFVLPDVKEGELSTSRIWLELYRRRYAKECGVAYEPENAAFCAAADAKYPIPKAIDFRMH